MSTVALLIGVSRYPPGLNPLLRAQKDVEVMRRVLRQPQFGFESVECFCNASLQEMQEAIETFFKNRSPDDRVLFLLTGYGIQDGDGKLYFATPETAADNQGRLIKSRAISASFVRDVMNSSPAKHQVMILDCQFQQGFDNTTDDDNPIDLSAQLDGNGRVILAASIFTHHAVETSDFDAWSYTRYLVEGIETSVADRDSNGVVSADDIHEYARRKLAIAAPAMSPQIYGSRESASLPLLSVPVQDRRVVYRKVLDDLVERRCQTNATATILLEDRSLLDEIKHRFGLSAQEAAELEAASLQPLRDYRQRQQAYQEKFSAIKLGNVGPNHQNNDDLKRYRQAFGLTDDNTAPIEAVPEIMQQQQEREQYQRNLVKYEQVLLTVMQRQYPLSEGDHRLLNHLQTALQLRDNDVRMIESELATRLHRRGTPPDLQSDLASMTRPPAEPYSGQPPAARTSSPDWASMQSRSQMNASPSPQPVPASYTVPPGEAAPLPSPLVSPGPSPVPPGATDPGPATRVQPLDEADPPSAPAPMSKPPNQSRWTFGVLIFPAILLAILIGVGAALLSSRNMVNPFNRTSSPPAADNPNEQTPLQQAARDINLGVTAHGIGDYNGAVRYYDQAVRVLADLCQRNTNTQTSQCQLLARAYSNRSYSYFNLQNYNQALNDANSAIVLDSNLAEAQINLANARFMQGDRAEAIQQYNQALEMKPSDPLQAGIYNNRGNVYFSQNNIQTALADYNQALALRSNYADAYFNRGLVHERQNDINNAISDFQNAAKFYREQNAFNLAEEAERRATTLQQNAPNSTPLPPA